MDGKIREFLEQYGSMDQAALVEHRYQRFRQM